MAPLGAQHLDRGTLAAVVPAEVHDGLATGTDPAEEFEAADGGGIRRLQRYGAHRGRRVLRFSRLLGALGVHHAGDFSAPARPAGETPETILRTRRNTSSEPFPEPPAPDGSATGDPVPSPGGPTTAEGKAGAVRGRPVIAAH